MTFRNKTPALRFASNLGKTAQKDIQLTNISARKFRNMQAVSLLRTTQMIAEPGLVGSP